jgi:hypothetical protein
MGGDHREARVDLRAGHAITAADNDAVRTDLGGEDVGGTEASRSSARLEEQAGCAFLELPEEQQELGVVAELPRINREASRFGVVVRALPEGHPAAPGYGVFALRVLPAGLFLPGYVGQLLSRKQFDIRYPAGDARYVLEISGETMIDAVDIKVANFSRMINHPLNVRTPENKKLKANVRIEDNNSIRVVRMVKTDCELLADYGDKFGTKESKIAAQPTVKAGLNRALTNTEAVVDGTLTGFGQVINYSTKDYPGRPYIVIRKADGSSIKGLRGEGTYHHFKRGTYVTFREDGSHNASFIRLSRAGTEVEVKTVGDIREVTESHSLPPIIRGVILRVSEFGGAILPDLDEIHFMPDQPGRHTRLFRWSNISSPKCRLEVGTPVLYSTHACTIGSEGHLHWAIVDKLEVDEERLQSKLKFTSSPSLVRGLDHWGHVIEFGGVLDQSHIPCFPACWESKLGDSRREGPSTLIEQALEVLRADIEWRRPFLTSEEKRDCHPVEMGHRLFSSLEENPTQTINILINPYTFSRITATDWCVAVEKYMQKASFCPHMKKVQVTIIQRLDHGSDPSNWRVVNVLQPLAKFNFKHLRVAEYNHVPLQFLRFRLPRVGQKVGEWTGGAEQKFKIVSLIFKHEEGPTEFLVRASRFESSSSGSASEAEEDWSDKHTVMFAIKASHGEADESLAYLSDPLTLPEAKRVSARRQNPHIDFKVRLATHQTPMGTKDSLDRLKVIADGRWAQGGTVPFMYLLGQIFLSPASGEFPVIQFGPAWEITAVFRSIGQRQMAMVGPNTARTVLHPGETLDSLVEDMAATNNELGKKRVAPLFLSLYHEQGGGILLEAQTADGCCCGQAKGEGARGSWGARASGHEGFCHRSLG